jgi:DNA-directed RNA polymerase subunit RPC12/RpoP
VKRKRTFGATTSDEARRIAANIAKLSMGYEPSRPVCLKNSAKPRSAIMLPFSYRCPDCGWDIETLVPEVTSNERDDAYQSAVCPNCQQLHSVNPANGEILVEDGLGDPR